MFKIFRTLGLTSRIIEEQVYLFSAISVVGYDMLSKKEFPIITHILKSIPGGNIYQEHALDNHCIRLPIRVKTGVEDWGGSILISLLVHLGDVRLHPFYRLSIASCNSPR